MEGPIMIYSMTDKESRDILKALTRSPKKVKNRTMSSENQENLVLERSDQENRMSSASAMGEYQNTQSHPVYSAISFINGQINRMDLNDLKQKCKQNNLDCHGKREAVKRRLKEYYKAQKLIEAGLLEPSVNRNVDYFVVIDFEATCEERNPPGYQHEIIEFPAVLVSSADPPHIVDIFHAYCKPTINPKLSEFCRTLTGIEQSLVDGSQTFSEVHQQFQVWLHEKHQCGTKYSYSIVTDGPFDMGRFLFLQTQHLRAEYPDYGLYWVNLRKCFANFYKGDFYSSTSSHQKLPGLQDMLYSLEMEFQGQPHSGLDDARNIARVLIRLISDRAFVRTNEKIVLTGNRNAHPTPHNYHARLQSVTAVTRKEAEAIYKSQKQAKNSFKEQDALQADA
ncbi:3'-5' exoribonuclease 1-like [Tigriopus californicus]|uniref:3'-5' exoribonuclease 1-like n=1 Tax=Tigriopus californicus TaxID=6832 RepID=UPI0027DAA7DD|nr:3'-5' exoribonuclease 1-like [Tigriopus californicus]|eukprot:TCALIF_07533-PA protein Name:"Similar to Eri1 3'-5' exoribonuclease 1 (Rattus norvegicus)" AED:0.29 eAED:0.29 QI:77/1/1/1/0.5/0.66/3/457/393